MKRPAETGGLAAAVALLIGHLLGIDDPDVLVALGIVVGALPAVITWLVDRFGGAGRGPAVLEGRPRDGA